MPLLAADPLGQVRLRLDHDDASFERAQRLGESLDGLRIQVGRGLVQGYEVRLRPEEGREREIDLLADRKVTNLPVAAHLLVDAECLAMFDDRTPGEGLASRLESLGDINKGRLVNEGFQGLQVVLPHVGHAQVAVPRDIPQSAILVLRRTGLTAEQAHQRRLITAAGAADGDARARAQLQVRILDDVVLVLGISERHVLGLEKDTRARLHALDRAGEREGELRRARRGQGKPSTITHLALFVTPRLGVSLRCSLGTRQLLLDHFRRHHARHDLEAADLGGARRVGIEAGLQRDDRLLAQSEDRILGRHSIPPQTPAERDFVEGDLEHVNEGRPLLLASLALVCQSRQTRRTRQTRQATRTPQAHQTVPTRLGTRQLLLDHFRRQHGRLDLEAANLDGCRRVGIEAGLQREDRLLAQREYRTLGRQRVLLQTPAHHCEVEGDNENGAWHLLLRVLGRWPVDEVEPGLAAEAHLDRQVTRQGRRFHAAHHLASIEASVGDELRLGPAQILALSVHRYHPRPVRLRGKVVIHPPGCLSQELLLRGRLGCLLGARGRRGRGQLNRQPLQLLGDEVLLVLAKQQQGLARAAGTPRAPDALHVHV
mmetsp:Transcript_110130/g.350924  ORF Transcript_110130/g.350924 Transcript_110130/m.350924 type:complete len:600 (+) Transcript_110130:200-1999(+)